MNTHRFSFLLYSLILLFVATPIVQALTGKWLSLLPSLAFILILVTAIFAASQTRRTLIFSITLASLAAIMDLLQVITAGGTALKLTYYTTSMVFLSYTIVTVSRIIFTSPRVDANIIKGSICIYLLVGVLFAIIYSTVEFAEPNSFKRPTEVALVAGDAENEELPASKDKSMDFGSAETSVALYYSLVTLTTLGYGDITPLTPIARMFASLEALIGQMFVAVLIARLVGIQISQAKDP